MNSFTGKGSGSLSISSVSAFLLPLEKVPAIWRADEVERVGVRSNRNSKGFRHLVGQQCN